MKMGNNLVKIRFFEEDVGYENLWAEPIAEDLYRIESIPFFVYNISVGDIVRARLDSESHIFLSVVDRSSHSTLRARLETWEVGTPEAETFMDRLEAIGAVIETHPPRLIALDISHPTLILPITKVLSESGIRWEWGDKSALVDSGPNHVVPHL